MNPDLLFCGTEFGCFFTIDGGEKWIQLSAGIPTIAIREMEIQRDEDDLVLASFGRGFFILDDYSPLRELTVEMLDESKMFPIKKGLMYQEITPLGRVEEDSKVRISMLHPIRNLASHSPTTSTSP